MNQLIGRIRGHLELLKEVIIIILAAVLVMTFLMNQSKIPSESMENTLNIDDRVIVSMVPFYYREPQRGEIVVFKQEDELWVKRVIGLPGQVIDIRQGNVYINDVFFDEAKYLKETGQSEPNSPWDEPVDFPYTVPEGSYFLMGDNRRSSRDCRYIGAIPRHLIIGKPIFRIYPFNNVGSIE